MITKKCLVCGKDFFKTSSYGKKGWEKRKYCSRACNLTINCKPAPKTGKIIICKICGKSFYSRNWELNGSKYKRQCCSWDCYNLSRKRTKIIIKCDYCGKEFSSRPDKISNQQNNFCSKKCSSEFLKKGKINSCEICGKEFYVHNCRLNSAKYCSNKCNGKSMEVKDIRNCPTCGKDFITTQSIKKTYCSVKCFGISHSDENATFWKGDDVGYQALHAWVRKKLGKPTKCEHCGKDGLEGKQIHWANKSGKYKRELTDWVRLCVSCHIKFDGKPWNKGLKLLKSNWVKIKA